MLGDTAIIKLFRRLELGHNLDIEVHGALNAADISEMSGLFGWVEVTGCPVGGSWMPILPWSLNRQARLTAGSWHSTPTKARTLLARSDGSGFAPEAGTR